MHAMDKGACMGNGRAGAAAADTAEGLEVVAGRWRHIGWCRHRGASGFARLPMPRTIP